MATASVDIPQQHGQPEQGDINREEAIMTEPVALTAKTFPEEESSAEEEHVIEPTSQQKSETEEEDSSNLEPLQIAEASPEVTPISETDSEILDTELHEPEIPAEPVTPEIEPGHSNFTAKEASIPPPSTPSVTVEEPKRADTPTTPDEIPTPTTEKSPGLATSGDNIDGLSENHLATSTQPQDPPLASPITSIFSQRTSVESMTSIALSETSLDYNNIPTNPSEDALATPRVSGIRHARKPSSLDIQQSSWPEPQRQSTFFDNGRDASTERRVSSLDGERDTWVRPIEDFSSTDSIDERNNSIADSLPSTNPRLSQSSRNSSVVGLRRASGESWVGEEAQVDWQALDKTEEQEKEDRDLPDGVEDESTTFLLARLEQENAKFTNDPKSVARARAQSRPPSMAHIKKLVAHPDAPTIRYSLVPELAMPDEPPPMTELEFWAALVQDYPSTAVRLPTLTTTKIRAGIPPPLRGVVWTSMSGARDKDLEEAFQKLVGEKSPYEGIINKDVGRSFPGVELFRDAEGEGQRMLGNVLKCFSLQDEEIGYCQGLGFLVGPLLMNMGESEAFCVLVRLMDHYSLRPSFLPSLSGLHMRIFQFTSLLKKHHRTLHDHLNDLGVEPAYLSQWFLSCFAVTCPLSMLFRIYDVIFAEGANETVMRIALALMRRHEDKMLEATEFEEVMQLLLGREIWDCYGGDADLLVDDFTSLGDTVTHARLVELERDFNNQSGETVTQNAGFLPDVQSAASRFLGRLWAPGQTQTISKPTVHTPKASMTNLSPNSADKESGPTGFFGRQPGFLRRSPSKQSITAVTDSQSSDESASASGSGSGSSSYASTAPTEHDVMGIHTIRESYADTISSRSKAESIAPTTPSVYTKEQQELHGQIEDLLTALSEMQREHAQLAAMLQREREERSEDHRSMREIVGKFSKTIKENRRRTAPSPQRIDATNDLVPKERPLSVGDRQEIVPESQEPKDEIEGAVEKLQERLNANTRFSFNLETKAQLRSALARTREQLGSLEALSRDLSNKLDNAEGETEDLRSEVKELRVRVADEFKLRQKMELQMQELKAKARSSERKQTMVRAGSSNEVPTLSRSNTSPNEPPGSAGSMGGLRELKLGRRESNSSIQSIRQSRQLAPIQIKATGGSLNDPALPSPASFDSSDTITAPVPTSPAPGSSGSASRKNRTSYYGRRTSSLVTKEVLTTPALEPIPDEALLLELINSKTSEAQAKNEVDELKKALSVGKRKQDETQRLHEVALEQLRAELQASKAEVAKAVQLAQAAKAESAALKSSTSSAASVSNISLPPTPLGDETGELSLGVSGPTTPGSEKAAEPKVAEASGGVGSWFWGRRTMSKSGIPPVAKEA